MLNIGSSLLLQSILIRRITHCRTALSNFFIPKNFAPRTVATYKSLNQVQAVFTCKWRDLICSTNQIFLSGHEFKENIRGLIILGCQATPTGSKVQGIRINFLDCSVSLNAKVYFSSKLLLVARNSSKKSPRLGFGVQN